MEEEDYQACLHNAVYEQPSDYSKSKKGHCGLCILYGPRHQYEAEATGRINETHSHP